MTAFSVIGGVIILILAGIIFIVLLSVPERETKETLIPFAILPVPDAMPSTQAFLRHLASQLAWMDTEVLRCVILIYPPENESIQELCQEMAREYSVYSVRSLAEIHDLIDKRTLQTLEIL